MKKRCIVMLAALLLSGILVAGFGMYLKQNVADPYQIYRNESPIALPFVLLARGELEEMLVELRTEEETPPEMNVILATQAELRESVSPVTALPEVITMPVTTAPSETTVPEITAHPEKTVLPEISVEPGETVQTTTDPPETVASEDTKAAPQEGMPVYGEDESFFDDALFIGDSRLCGLRDYARLGEADYFCDVGMTIFNVRDRQVSDVNFASTSLDSLLASKQYGKVYISLGINECGYPMDSLISGYNSLVQTIQSAQPDAKIVLQSIMTVSRSFASSASYFAVDHLAEINSHIASMADGGSVYYIDVNEVMADSEGYLPDEMSWDGCHLYGKYNSRWAQWLCEISWILFL